MPEPIVQPRPAAGEQAENVKLPKLPEPAPDEENDRLSHQRALELVAELGHNDFDIRQKASRELEKQAGAAAPYIFYAAGSEDPEIALRGLRIIERNVNTITEALQRDAALTVRETFDTPKEADARKHFSALQSACRMLQNFIEKGDAGDLDRLAVTRDHPLPHIISRVETTRELTYATAGQLPKGQVLLRALTRDNPHLERCYKDGSPFADTSGEVKFSETELQAIADEVLTGGAAERGWRPSAVLTDVGAQIVPAVAKRLQTLPAEAQVQALTALERFGEQASAAAPVISTLAADSTAEHEVRLSAITVLSRIPLKDDSIIQNLRAIAMNEKEEGISSYALKTLAENSQLDDALLGRLADLAFTTTGGGQVRRNARDGIAAQGEAAEPLIPRLQEALESPDPDNRAAAASLLSSIGPKAGTAAETVGMLALQDREAKVRTSAINALGYLGESGVEELYKVIHQSREVEDRRNAVIALSALHAEKDAKVRTFLKDLLKNDKSTAVREAALVGLTCSKTAELSTILHYLQDEQQRVRLTALGGISVLLDLSREEKWNFSPNEQQDILAAVEKVALDKNENESVRVYASMVLEVCRKSFEKE